MAANIARFRPQTESTDVRRARFTDKVLAQIPIWVADGWSLDAIADRIGTTTGGLYTECSRRGISLSGAKRPLEKRKSVEIMFRIPMSLHTALTRKADALGMSVEMLIAVLLEQIADGNLFTAVLDFEER